MPEQFDWFLMLGQIYPAAFTLVWIAGLLKRRRVPYRLIACGFALCLVSLFAGFLVVAVGTPSLPGATGLAGLPSGPVAATGFIVALNGLSGMRCCLVLWALSCLVSAVLHVAQRARRHRLAQPVSGQ